MLYLFHRFQSVLVKGGIFGINHVNFLEQEVKNYLRLDLKNVCLATSVKAPDETQLPTYLGCGRACIVLVLKTLQIQSSPLDPEADFSTQGRKL